MTRIGTWNLDGRWSDRHRAFVESQECDVWLLTEVKACAVPDGWHAETSGCVTSTRTWSAVWSRRLGVRGHQPHVATAAAVIDGVTYWSSVHPWRSGGTAPWVGERHDDKTRAVVGDLRRVLPRGPLVWGGDWNHAPIGREYAGSQAGRLAIVDLLDHSGLRVTTAHLAHRRSGALTIDHVAVPAAADVHGCRLAVVDGVRLSDHDAYVVDVDVDVDVPRG